jgi:hypothetical protein
MLVECRSTFRNALGDDDIEVDVDVDELILTMRNERDEDFLDCLR